MTLILCPPPSRTPSTPADVWKTLHVKGSHFQCIVTPQVPVLCLYACVRVLVGWCVCVCVCVFACLSGLRVCLSVYEQRRSVCVHCPTVSAEKITLHLFGDSALAVKKQESKKCGGREGGKKKKKKKPRQPRDISILAPRFPQAAGGRLQNGSTPRHRVGSALSKCL